MSALNWLLYFFSFMPHCYAMCVETMDNRIMRNKSPFSTHFYNLWNGSYRDPYNLWNGSYHDPF